MPLKKGDFLLEYQGELISKDESKEDGSLERLVNDDDISPNAKMKYLTVQGKPHLCLFAIREINQGEEITYNYGDSDWPWRCKKEAENAGAQMAANIPNETDPVLDVLPPLNAKVF
ncbi:hypothetical protein CRENBAI_006009 [Crenichthys baileyi]|uniref:SET domain-containing protein n=1 Tax=Crenichthys baileyi TaxID=28760 RepID=A0AAV9QU17_9TELE